MGASWAHHPYAHRPPPPSLVGWRGLSQYVNLALHRLQGEGPARRGPLRLVPRRVFRRDEAMRLRESGMSWRKIAVELKVPVTTVVEGCR